MDDASIVSMEWDRVRQTCVARPAAALGEFVDVKEILRNAQVNGGDPMAVLLHKFVAAAFQIGPSLTTLNLARLYLDDDYRTRAVTGMHLGYKQGREASLADWKGILDEFIDQLLVVTANSLEDPSAFIVGTAATAIQLYADDPFAGASPAAHAQLNDWIDRARKQIWAGVVPPPPPELPEDDLAQAKAAFIIDVLAQVLAILFDPASVVFATLAIPDIVEAYRAWEDAEAAELGGFVSVLLTAICEPATLGYNLGYRHGQADVNTNFILALRITEWLPSPI